ncbi:SUMF1/EgtB/PvdO family nonheme iron enzyme [Thiohalocapsa sp. ML1]|uniref:nSTAND1 domain-containing NTPase n=1 Tax=Thiohalocapsa sp. ML1 TaxID=1431688 RepID=UPI000732264F|nr:SUMF1/EgtB/PvdO family nonheme iron enzyme [Thiohalocapsa sp. ML1]
MPKDAILDDAVLRDLQSLLVLLPVWQQEGPRRGFAECALGTRHPVLDEMTWAGGARDAAWELVRHCSTLRTPVALPGGPPLPPLCALLAEARERYANHADAGPRIADLAARLGCPGFEVQPDWDHEPYPGMAAFDHTQAPIFFGRETETGELLAKLQGKQGRRLVLVTGRSGSGKSSLARAGLWASLHDAARTPIAGSADWVISPMKPADEGLSDPFRTLLLGLREAEPRVLGLRDGGQEARALRDDPQAFADLRTRVLAGRPQHAEWLLIIDQFEELFTSIDKALSALFLDRLTAALHLDRFRVVATVRSDFHDACIAHRGLRAEMNHDGSQYHVDAPDTGALAAMVTGPLARKLRPESRAEMDTDLARRLVQDAAGQPGSLALLAFALKDLYDRCRREHAAGLREQPRMCLTDYLPPPDAGAAEAAAEAEAAAPAPAVSGLDRIIRDRAEKAAAVVGDEAEQVLPRVFSRLLTVQADGAATRKREDLCHWDDDADARKLVDALSATDTRLLVKGAARTQALDAPRTEPDAPAGRVVEVAHEALFRAWPALADWIGRRKEALIRAPQVQRDARRWHAEGRRDKDLPTHMLDDLRRLFDAAELWPGLVKDEPLVAHYLAHDDAAELFALTLEAHTAGDADARGHLLHTLTRFERKAETLTELVRQLRERDAEQGSDIAGWLRAGIDIDALFAGPDAERWYRHRVAVGDLLDALGDDRDGIGVDADGLPAIAWCEVPAGELIWQDGEQRTTGAYRIARYPITNAQYRAFVQADDYADDAWWPRDKYTAYEHKWTAGNRPRVAMNWLEAVAFCRWLTARLRARGDLTDQQEVRLPTELEWEKAARGMDGREFPWVGEYTSGAANVDETAENDGPLKLNETTAVGLYPGNRSPYGLMDCAGNVWEWCLNKFDDLEDVSLDGDEMRAVRGGSWDLQRAASRAAFRNRDLIDGRSNTLGFRVCCAGPIR